MSAQIPIFDLHCHVMEPSTLIPEKDFQAPQLDNARNIISFLGMEGIEKIAVPAITHYASADLPCNLLALYAKILAPEKVYALAGLRRSLGREDGLSIVKQAYSLLSVGFDGFKLICKPNLRRSFKYPINDPMFDAFYAEAEKQSWPILFHVGDPESFWQKDKVPDWAVKNGWYYGDDPDIPSYAGLYEEVNSMLGKYPKLHIAFAHFFFMSQQLDKIPSFFESYPNIRFDLTPGSEMYDDFAANNKKAYELFTAYPDRFLFGTDNSGCNGALWNLNFKQGIEKVAMLRNFFETNQEITGFDYPVKGLALPKAVLEKIYHGNFTTFLNKPSKVVDVKAAANLADEYRHSVIAGEFSAENAEVLLTELEKSFKLLSGN